MISLTPQQIKQHQLTDAIADTLADSAIVQSALDALDMQPSSMALEHAACAAVSVLLAHDLGYSNDEIARQPRQVAVGLNGHGKAKRAAPKAKAGSPLKGRKQHKEKCSICSKMIAVSRMPRHLEKKHPEFQSTDVSALDAGS